MEIAMPIQSVSPSSLSFSLCFFVNFQRRSRPRRFALFRFPLLLYFFSESESLKKFAYAAIKRKNKKDLSYLSFLSAENLIARLGLASI